jgi:hypothetical protein
MKPGGKKIEQQILDKLLSMGASLAGFASIEELKKAPSYPAYDASPFYKEYKGVTWRQEHKTILVWALSHPKSKPELDWWNLKIPGFTPGNGMLRMQSKKTQNMDRGGVGYQGIVPALSNRVWWSVP